MNNKYFARCARFDLMDGHIVVIDPKSPRVVTLDPWLEVIFSAADGQRTTDQYIDHLKTQYPGGAPRELPQQTTELMGKLEAEGLIRFVDGPVELPYYLSVPVSQQDKDRALTEMKKDGFIK